MLIRSKAPLRISFSGGGTDISPYREEHGGIVLSATIDKHTYATLQPRARSGVSVESLDSGLLAKNNPEQPHPNDWRLDLLKAAVARLFPDNPDLGLNVFMHADTLPGSGLGASSSLAVGVVGLLREWQQLPITNYDLAELAFEIERSDMGLEGGRQDQYAAAFGGFNLFEFHRDGTVVNPLDICSEVISELQYNLLLCHTGKTRASADIIRSQVDNYVTGRLDVSNAMDQLKSIAVDMRECLLEARLDDFGALLGEAWRNKKQMAPGISSSFIDEMYDTARNQGALGGKVSGAGGGGFMFFYCPFDRRNHIAEALEKLGARIVDFHFERKGLETWQVGK